MLTVVVPVHNGGAQLTCCLRALQASFYRDFELLVVDDCSTDRTAHVIKAHGARYLRTSHRLGPAGARNLAARHARGDILVFVDADVQVPPEALGLIAENFGRRPDLAGVFGSYDQEPSASGFFSHYKNLFHHYIHQHSNENATTFWAGCGALRRNIFEQFGGFHSAKYQRPAIEDIESGLRLRRAGQRILLDKRLQVKHLKRWTLTSMIRSDIRDRAVPWSKLILESGKLPRDLNLTYASRVSALSVMLLVLFALQLLHSVSSSSRLVSLDSLAILSLALLLITLNYRVYQFFWKQRGPLFALGAVPMHWLYYFYSGVVWVCCYVAHHAGSTLHPPSTAPAKLPELPRDRAPKATAITARPSVDRQLV